jgi:hypothetical protein
VAPTYYRNLVQLTRGLPQQSGISGLPHTQESLTKFRNHKSVIQGSVSARTVLEHVLPQNWRNGGQKLALLVRNLLEKLEGASTEDPGSHRAGDRYESHDAPTHFCAYENGFLHQEMPVSQSEDLSTLSSCGRDGVEATGIRAGVFGVMLLALMS